MALVAETSLQTIQQTLEPAFEDMKPGSVSNAIKCDCTASLAVSCTRATRA